MQSLLDSNDTNITDRSLFVKREVLNLPVVFKKGLTETDEKGYMYIFHSSNGGKPESERHEESVVLDERQTPVFFLPRQSTIKG